MSLQIIVHKIGKFFTRFDKIQYKANLQIKVIKSRYNPIIKSMDPFRKPFRLYSYIRWNTTYTFLDMWANYSAHFSHVLK